MQCDMEQKNLMFNALASSSEADKPTLLPPKGRSLDAKKEKKGVCQPVPCTPLLGREMLLMGLMQLSLDLQNGHGVWFLSPLCLLGIIHDMFIIKITK